MTRPLRCSHWAPGVGDRHRSEQAKAWLTEERLCLVEADGGPGPVRTASAHRLIPSRSTEAAEGTFQGGWQVGALGRAGRCRHSQACVLSAFTNILRAKRKMECLPLFSFDISRNQPSVFKHMSPFSFLLQSLWVLAQVLPLRTPRGGGARPPSGTRPEALAARRGSVTSPGPCQWSTLLIAAAVLTVCAWEESGSLI